MPFTFVTNFKINSVEQRNVKSRKHLKVTVNVGIPDVNNPSIKERLKDNLILVVLMLAMGIVAINAQASKGDFMLGSDLGSGLIGKGSSGLSDSISD